MYIIPINSNNYDWLQVVNESDEFISQVQIIYFLSWCRWIVLNESKSRWNALFIWWLCKWDFRRITNFSCSTWQRRWAEQRERSSTSTLWIWRGWVYIFSPSRGAFTTFSYSNSVNVSVSACGKSKREKREKNRKAKERGEGHNLRRHYY